MQWAQDWQIKFKNVQCKVLYVGKDNHKYKHFMGGRELECIEVEK